MKIDKGLVLIIAIIIAILFINKQDKKEISLDKSNDHQKNSIVIVTPSVDIEYKKIYENDLHQANKAAIFYKKPLLIIFGAEWCVYCKALKKDLEGFPEIQDYIVCLIDIEKDRSLYKDYGVKGLPTTVIVQENQEIDRIKGYNKTLYGKFLRKYIQQ